MDVGRGLAVGLALAVAGCRPSNDNAATASGPLVIYSTTDRDVFLPVIAEFRRLSPGIDVRYVEMDAGPLYRRYLGEVARGRGPADLLISSAMDLQVKLVNDGYAAAHQSENAAKLPAWARWRNEAFGITFEPAVMVYNRRLLAGRHPPGSRPELLKAIRTEPDFWRARIGTYDIIKSSVGYLLASQDARQNSDFGSLLEALGAARMQVSTSTATLLDRIEQGEIALGYNLLGSYAQARVDRGAPLMIVYPADYTLAVSRTAILARDAPHPAAAHAFLEYLLSLQGQRALASLGRLSASRPEIIGPYSRLGIAETQIGPLRPIALGPGLLTYLDRQKRGRLTDSWQHAVRPAGPGTMSTGR